MSPCAFSSLALVAGLGVAPAAAADSPSSAWYSADTVAEQSVAFGQVTTSVGPAWDAATKELRILGRAAEELEIGVAMGGDRVPADLSEWALGVRRRINAAGLQAQKHVDLLGEDYDRVFRAAVDRAAAAHGGATECEAPPRKGPAVPGMAPPKPACPGTDVSAAIARDIDADAVLAAELAEIAGVPWPRAEVEPRSAAVIPVAGSARWVQLAPLARALWSDRLDARTDDLDRGLARLAPDGDLSDPAVLAQATELRRGYEAALAKDGERLLTALQGALGKGALKDLGDVGVCVNPPEFGGCAGEDVTDRALPLLKADRKLAKALAD
ncbi:MAG: hypothetical protein H6742_05190 [Alphaproteobacteria bacterium]|nr:hypothetical protein [Alphaproteobacteria bacterium]